jgi:L-alanine-DL-glutamate epimerase-like enolase superfamily enzyme
MRRAASTPDERMSAPRCSVLEIRCHERPVVLRLPFRFGAVTVTHAPQAFVRARIRLDDRREAWGAAAELLVPKWFDKDPALTESASFDQLRRALRLACEHYTGGRDARTAFGHFAAHYEPQLATAARAGLPPLVAAFGSAEIDKALVDALGRALDLPFATLVQRNLLGIAASPLTPDLAGFDLDAFLRTLAPPPALAVRHTVGMLDVIAGHPQRANDGLPESLAEAITAYGLTCFKLKLAGDVNTDLARLTEVAALLDRMLSSYLVTLDGNEQYDDLDALGELVARIFAAPQLAAFAARIAFIEQPVARAVALNRDVRRIAQRVPLIIDESDATLDAFPRAREQGYAGVSSKACKGLYKSLLNRARCAAHDRVHGGACFMSAEDLTTQAGLALQQDLALAALLGVAHVERNGHHYVEGFAGQRAPAAEQDGFVRAHPDLYVRSQDRVRVRIGNGMLQLQSLACPGFASGAQPDWSSLDPLREPSPRNTGQD